MARPVAGSDSAWVPRTSRSASPRLNGPLSSSNGGVEADLSDLPAQLPVDTVDPSCTPPQVTVDVKATTVAVPGFDSITLERLTLVRPIDPADTLNALGGTWQLAPVEAPPPA
jgi:hypothetical protein